MVAQIAGYDTRIDPSQLAGVPSTWTALPCPVHAPVVGMQAAGAKPQATEPAKARAEEGWDLKRPLKAAEEPHV